MNKTVMRRRFNVAVDALYEAVAWVLYSLSKVRLACKPSYSTCIAECITCGYRIDHNGFYRFPLHRLAWKFERELETAREKTKG